MYVPQNCYNQDIVEKSCHWYKPTDQQGVLSTRASFTCYLLNDNANEFLILFSSLH